jgi:peptidoglycan/xylan/chitin deacetylase (PgdA/CDA1 family)
VVRPPLILCYHAISEGWKHRLAVEGAELAGHLTLLRDRGYDGLTFAEAERRRQAGTLAPQSVVVTFDDGFASLLRALPVLAAVGWPATVFVVTRFVESGDPLAWPGLDPPPGESRPLGWEGLERLVAAGWEIGSHTVDHPLLTRLDDDQLDAQLFVSKQELEKRLGSCETLAYPYGLADRRVAARAQRAGYLAACTSTHTHRVDEAHRRPRVSIARGDSGLRLAAKLSPAYLTVRRTLIGDLVDRIRLVVDPSRERLFGK